MTEQPARHTVGTITSDALDQLYAERDEARAAADRYLADGTKAVERLHWRAYNAEQRAEQAEAALAEARQWARHGYEIGQRHCGWSDHGVAPTWLTEGWPRVIDSCEHLQHLTRAEDTIARARRLASDWAVLRTHGGAAYELRAALEPQEPTP
jgi:hypothetical protein